MKLLLNIKKNIFKSAFKNYSERIIQKHRKYFYNNIKILLKIH